MGLEAEVEGSSKRDEAVLGSLGYLNPQDSRASPVMLASEPEAQPRGSAAPYSATVLRSFGYGNWNYGRASPLATSLQYAARANGSAQQNTTVLKSIGYLDWQDGRALAVVDDGDDGVRLIHKGELLDDNRFEVVKVNSATVEVAEVPISRPSLPGNPTFQTSSRLRTTGHASRPARLEEPNGSIAEARLEPMEGQFSSLGDRLTSQLDESSVGLPAFESRGQEGPCLNFKSLLMVQVASPGPWITSGLNLYFPQGANPAFLKGVSAGCAGASARLH
ncbi:MAG: hypothetical protein ACYDA9_20105 [Terriglobia bacterium]